MLKIQCQDMKLHCLPWLSTFVILCVNSSLQNFPYSVYKENRYYICSFILQDIEESLQNRHEQLKKIQNTIRYFEKKSTGLQDYRTDFLNLISNDDEEILVAEICPEYLELLNRIQKKETEDGREIDLELVSFSYWLMKGSWRNCDWIWVVLM